MRGAEQAADPAKEQGTADVAGRRVQWPARWFPPHWLDGLGAAPARGQSFGIGADIVSRYVAAPAPRPITLVGGLPHRVSHWLTGPRLIGPHWLTGPWW